jgi:acetylornithine deacetylase/succinyl-diaminopimelate desuccinylase-like protein
MKPLALVFMALAGLTLQAQVNTVDLALLDQSIQENASSHLAFLQELSRTTEKGEEAVQILVAERMNQLGCEVETIKYNPPEITWISGSEAVETKVDHPLYQTASRAIVAVTGEQPYVNALHTASDIRNPILHSGIPTIGFGPLAGRGSGPMIGSVSYDGSHDTWVDIEDYIRAVQITARIIINSSIQ